MTPLPVSVRLTIAKDRGTPERLLRRLAADPDEAVRAAAVSNPNAPIGLRSADVAVEQPLSRTEFSDFLAAECNDCGFAFTEVVWFPLDHECPSCGSADIFYEEGWV